jgi:hypothetical protein
LLHLEVFAGPDLPTFIAKSQLRAKELSEADPNMESHFWKFGRRKTGNEGPGTGLRSSADWFETGAGQRFEIAVGQGAAQNCQDACPAAGAPCSGWDRKHKPKPAKKPEPIETPIGSPFGLTAAWC